MSKTNADPSIRLRGVRHNNLKNFDLDLPLGRLIVITGLSGSGKSSLAFDTLYAEGQRRYIETFSPYARQFFDRMDKPQVDRIDGIPPAIAIEQRNTVKTTRSTVGTMTEICDHMKLLWPHLARLHCRQCGQPVRKEPPQAVWEKVNAECGMQNAECLITFDLPLSEKLSLPESLGLVAKQGYQRLLVGSEIIRIDEAATHSAFRAPYTALTIIQDRLKPTAATRARFIEACEQAYHYGQGKLAIHRPGVTPVPHFALRTPHFFSAGFHCAACDLDYREPTPALFSYNHPIGACPACKGFGRVISIDYHLALPDRSKPLAGGCVKPWQTGHGLESQADLMKFCKKRKVPVDIPFAALPKEAQDWVIHGDPDYGQDSAHEWPRAWYGVKGYFRWLESKSYKMHVRVLLSRYRAYTTCPDCHGRRFNADSLLYQFTNDDLRFTSASPETPTARKSSFVNRKFTLADFYQLSIEDALAVLERLSAHSALRTPHSAFEIVLTEVRARLRYLVEVGLGYLTLDRPTRTLSGGETSRVNLTTCLGTRLVNTLFVLDEPSVGLHLRDTARLVRILENLRDAGNTVVVVEHEASVMRAADQIIDLGPGQGEAGGEIMFQGTFADLLQSDRSLTGQYLSGRKQIEVPERRPVSLVAADVRRLTSNSEALALNETPIPYRATSDLTPALSPGEREKHSPPMFDSETAPTTERAKLSPRRKASLPLPGGEGRGEGERSSHHAPVSTALQAVTWIGAITAVFAALVAVAQTDIKRILAYSTVSQLGFMFMGLGTGGVAVGMFHLLTHAFFKALLFLGAGAVIHALHHEQDIWKMGGLSKTMRITTATFALGTLALTGCPGLAGFFSKDAILLAAFAHNKALFGIGLATAFLTAFYMTRLFAVAFLGKPRSEAAHHGHDCPRHMTWPLVILAFLSIFAAYGAVPHWFGVEHGDAPKIVPTLAILAFLTGTGVAWMLYAGAEKEPLSLPLFRNKFYFDEIYGAIVAGTQDVLAFIAAGVDAIVLTVVRAVGGLTLGLGYALRLFQVGNVQAYAFIFGLGVVGLIWFLIFR